MATLATPVGVARVSHRTVQIGRTGMQAVAGTHVWECRVQRALLGIAIVNHRQRGPAAGRADKAGIPWQEQRTPI